MLTIRLGIQFMFTSKGSELLKAQCTHVRGSRKHMFLAGIWCSVKKPMFVFCTNLGGTARFNYKWYESILLSMILLCYLLTYIAQ